MDEMVRVLILKNAKVLIGKIKELRLLLKSVSQTMF